MLPSCRLRRLDIASGRSFPPPLLLCVGRDAPVNAFRLIDILQQEIKFLGESNTYQFSQTIEPAGKLKPCCLLVTIFKQHITLTDSPVTVKPARIVLRSTQVLGFAHHSIDGRVT